ncbi:hypothetical protein J1N35_035764, partial [Gossypium stocksii]
MAAITVAQRPAPCRSNAEVFDGGDRTGQQRSEASGSGASGAPEEERRTSLFILQLMMFLVKALMDLLSFSNGESKTNP